MGLQPSRSCVSLLDVGLSAANERREETEPLGRLLGWLTHHGDAKAPTENLREVAEGDALLRDPVVRRPCGPLLERQPEETGHVQTMHRGPAVTAVAEVGRLSLLPGDFG